MPAAYQIKDQTTPHYLTFQVVCCLGLFLRNRRQLQLLRIKQQHTEGSHTIGKVWAGACEYITQNGQQKTLTYLSGPEGVFALHVIYPDGSDSIRYIHKDHLGSWHTITDENGNLLQELSFDAWGNRRNPSTWRAFTGSPPAPLFGRGFTGHEHLYTFGLINMNGRMYDPLVSRMLSPDNFIQAPDFSQSFNRYSYVWNNPLVLTDPDGEIIFTIIGALLAPVTGGASLAIGIAMDVGGAINLGIKASQGQLHSVGDGLAAYGIGAAAGAVGYLTGGAAFAAAGGAAGGAGGFLAGFAGGAIGSAYAMPVQSIGNTIYFGDPLMTPEQYALGILGGGVLGGSIQGISALVNGKPFLTGTLKPTSIATPAPRPMLQIGKPEVKLNTDGMRSQLKPIPGVGKYNPNEGIYYLDNAKNAIKYSDGVPTQVVRDPNFRNNLISSSGVNPGSSAHAHHVFPLKFAPQFQSAGINTNSYGAWWGSGHLNNASQYNNAWGAFLRTNPGASQSEIFREAIRLKIIFGY